MSITHGALVHMCIAIHMIPSGNCEVLILRTYMQKYIQECNKNCRVACNKDVNTMGLYYNKHE